MPCLRITPFPPFLWGPVQNFGTIPTGVYPAGKGRLHVPRGITAADFYPGFTTASRKHWNITVGKINISAAFPGSPSPLFLIIPDPLIATPEIYAAIIPFWAGCSLTPACASLIGALSVINRFSCESRAHPLPAPARRIPSQRRPSSRRGSTTQTSGWRQTRAPRWSLAERGGRRAASVLFDASHAV